MSYVSTAIRNLLAQGTQPDEDFYRLRVWGNGSTQHLNVSPESLEKIAEILDEEVNGIKIPGAPTYRPIDINDDFTPQELADGIVFMDEG